MFPITSNSNSDSDSTLYVDDVFSTWLYTGNGSAQTITNGIDLAGKGGLVWVKNRTDGAGQTYHGLFDTARNDKALASNLTSGQGLGGEAPMSFLPNGFTLNDGNFNNNNFSHVSWTFRKAPKFFDIVTYTGDGSSDRQLAHLLGITPGLIIIKSTTTTSNWGVLHRGDGSSDYKLLRLNALNGQLLTYASAQFSSTKFGFTNWGAFTGNSNDNFNTTGQTYVAYLFAHDTSLTGFIQCGIYTGNGDSATSTANGPDVYLGWEPQYVMIKSTASNRGWELLDIMRGIPYGGNTALMYANDIMSDAVNERRITLTATGFKITNYFENPSEQFIYIAIRRPNKPPASSAQVFSLDAYTETISGFRNVGFAPDMAIQLRRSGDTKIIWDKLRGNTASLSIESTAAENGVYSGGSYPFGGFNNTGWSTGYLYNNQSGALSESYVFKRSPGFFDEVCYTTPGSTFPLISHNLGVVPELIIVRRRDGSANWGVQYVPFGNPSALYLNGNDANGVGGWSYYFTPSSVTSTMMQPTTSMSGYTAGNYVAYLFATLSGISKVGSYTGNGSSKNIDCGFGSNYSAFVLIKRTDSTGDWYVWDTARGITTSIDPHLSLNTATAEVSTTNSIDLVSSGFTVIQNSTTNINVTNATYIYLSIASSVSYLTGGEALFTTPGTFYWTCPAGVTAACVVCIGAGGGSGSAYGLGNSSGAGGSLNYLNNYAVTPGQVYTVVVGDRAVNGGIAGSSSCFGITAGGGGSETNRSANVGGTAFNGGNAGGGGGGAGGYTGPGGVGGGQLNDSQTPRNGQGLGAGGGGGGGGANTGSSNAGGGGASLYGGAGGNGGFSNYNTAGTGGAAASTTTNNGESGKSGVGYGGGNGGKYGGGGGALNISGSGDVSGIGGTGAVRIMWGSGRSFPYSAG